MILMVPNREESKSVLGVATTPCIYSSGKTWKQGLEELHGIGVTPSNSHLRTRRAERSDIHLIKSRILRTPAPPALLAIRTNSDMSLNHRLCTENDPHTFAN
jgi:hypothetical protein